MDPFLFFKKIVFVIMKKSKKLRSRLDKFEIWLVFGKYHFY